MRIRPGDESDLATIITIIDEAIAWMVSQGNTVQWGEAPWRGQPRRVDNIRNLLSTGELWMAEMDGEPAGAMIVSDQPMAYIKPVDEPELYVKLLVTSRRYAGNKIGEQLLAKAKAEAIAKGVCLMRVDCYAGHTGELVKYYERNGFVRAETFTAIPDRPVQILTQRL
jgi:GNAT superfamily N-acetyltransferase